MKNLFNKAAATLSGLVLFAFGCVMAGLGLATVSLLALFALFAVGLSLLAAPFAAHVQPATEEETDETVEATVTA